MAFRLTQTDFLLSKVYLNLFFRFLSKGQCQFSTNRRISFMFWRQVWFYFTFSIAINIDIHWNGGRRDDLKLCCFRFFFAICQFIARRDQIRSSNSIWDLKEFKYSDIFQSSYLLTSTLSRFLPIWFLKFPCKFRFSFLNP